MDGALEQYGGLRDACGLLRQAQHNLYCLQR